jgi:glycosyltransferase involved in cell wall biosynthesis
MDGRNLLLFGCDFFSVRKTSEINFWNDLVTRFADYFDQVVVLSINNRRIAQEKLGSNIFIYNERPHYFGNSGKQKDPDYTGTRFHKLPLANLYKSYTFLRLQNVFDKIIREHNIGIVHYMRVFGLLNQQLIRRYPNVLFSITVPTHIDRGFPLHLMYHTFKNAALHPMDRIIPTSEATYQRLAELGIPREKLEVIRWSVETEEVESKTNPLELKGSIRSELNLAKDADIVLWSGPLQHTGNKEFRFSLEVAKRTTQLNPRMVFVFAFKPDKLNQDHLNAAKDNPHIRVIETGRREFRLLQQEASLFLSPICNEKRTAAPPLTWIEMMSLGIPVVTTNVAGVSELIQHGRNGYIANSISETADLLSGMKVTEQIRQACRNTIDQEYNLDNIAAQYVSMWQRSIKHQGYLAASSNLPTK